MAIPKLSISFMPNPEQGSPRPLVSVLMPFRNAAGTLPACLDSVGAQSLVDYEFLAIDDGSEDRSRAIVAKRARYDQRIRLLDNLNPGLVPALNLGLDCARAPFVARMDADDLMSPQRLALQSEYLRRNRQIALVASQVRLFPDERIMASETGPTPVAHLRCLQRELRIASTHITFVDGGVRQLDAVFHLGVKCVLATWSHNGPREQDHARERGYRLCSLEDAEAQLFD